MVKTNKQGSSARGLVFPMACALGRWAAIHDRHTHRGPIIHVTQVSAQFWLVTLKDFDMVCEFLQLAAQRAEETCCLLLQSFSSLGGSMCCFFEVLILLGHLINIGY